MRSAALALFSTLFASIGISQAQEVFAMPGAASTGTSISVYQANPLNLISNNNASPGSFLTLGTPDASKFFIIGGNAVTVLDSSFGNARMLGPLSQSATGAALTPDGKKLLVAAGNLVIYDTTVTPETSTTVNVNSSAYDVAVSLDGKRAFVLGASPNAAAGSILTAVDLSQNAVVATLAVGGRPNTTPGLPSPGVTLAPDGLVYVSTQNQILEINPATLAITPGGTISLNALPTKPVFTSDGQYAVTSNATPTTGSVVIAINLASRNVATVGSQSPRIDQLFPITSKSLIGFSRQTGSLYQITINPNGTPTLSQYSSTLPAGTVTAAAISNDIPFAGGPATRFLFVVIGGSLYQISLNGNQVSQPVSTSIAIGALSYVAPAVTSGGAVTILEYGANQTVAPGTASLPLVIRALDPNDRPIAGRTVTFSSPNTGVQLQTTTAVTTADGFAETIATVPNTNGQLTVNATVDNQTVSFLLNVGAATTTPAPSAQITITAGQGQYVPEQFNTGVIPGVGSPMTVQVTDSNGKPIAGTLVTFTIVQGIGSIGCVVSSTGVAQSACTPASFGSLTVTTDANGTASIIFQSASLPPQGGVGFIQTEISASAPGTNTVIFYVSTSSLTFFNKPQVLTPQIGSVLTGQVGTIQRGAIQVGVVSYLGEPIPNVSVFTVNALDPTKPPAAVCVDMNGNPTVVLTGTTGIATCDLKFVGPITNGTLAQIDIETGYTSAYGPYTVQITPGPPAIVQKIQGDAQTGRPGQQLPQALIIQVTDSAGDILSGVPVTFTVSPPNAATLKNTSSTTDASGRASATVTLGNATGSFTVTVTAGAASAIFNLTSSVPVGSLQIVSGSGQSVTAGSAFGAPLVVQVLDTSGNPVQGATVTFAVASGSATLSATSAVTGANGQAQVNVTAGSSPGSVTITATAAGFSQTFSLTVTPIVPPGPANVQIVNGASFQPNSISPGTIATITGTGIAPSVQGTVTSTNLPGAPLPTTLAGVTVTFNGVPAPIYSVSNLNGTQQVNVQVPFETPVGTTAVAITGSNGGVTTVQANVQQVSPGVFSTTVNGQQYAVVIHSDGSYVTQSNPAHPGETVILFATGLGQATPALVTGATGLGQTVNATIIVGVNNAGVPVISSTYAANLVGVYEVQFQIPGNTQTGPAQPVGFFAVDSNGNSVGAPGTLIPIM